MLNGRLHNNHKWATLVLLVVLFFYTFYAGAGSNTQETSAAQVESEAADTPAIMATVAGQAIKPQAAVVTTAAKRKGSVASFSNSDGSVRVDYDLTTGTFDCSFNGALRIKGAYAGVQVNKYITSRNYSSRTYAVDNISDRNGNGIKVDITCAGSNPTMLQSFYIYDGKTYILSEVRVESSKTLASNWMAPLVVDTAGGVDIGRYSDNRLLQIPFDNDSYARYNASSVNKTGTSYEACAFYDNKSRNGLIMGSVEHDTWKTGIYYKGTKNRLDKLNIYGGASNAKSTHDQVSHGKVTGTSVKSPLIFTGYYSDWRTGLEAFATVNTYTQNKLDWKGGVPFGWNSWGGLGMGVSYTKAVTTASFIKNSLMPNNFKNGFNTVNLDSSYLSDDELARFAAACHKNGQKAGIYWTPFAYWGDSLNQPVEGAYGYTYSDCVLKGYDGKPLARMDGAYPLDPTSPAVTARSFYYIDKFKSMGFDYIKLDFMTHGTLEGKHSDGSITTGIQAFNYGMQNITSRIAGSMFISLSIAPLFPYQYANSRRISCDTFGSTSEVEYMLNSVTYGWWMSGKLYDYNDPDHMTLYRDSRGNTYGDTEARTRVTSAAIAGTVFLIGDDLSIPDAQKRVLTYLTNAAVNNVAKSGKSFTPVEGNTGTQAADTFVQKSGNNTFYIAVFNYSTNKSRSKGIDLARAGLDGNTPYNVKDLWTGEITKAEGTLKTVLKPGESGIYMLYP